MEDSKQSADLAEVRDILTRFSWETDDRQAALLKIAEILGVAPEVPVLCGQLADYQRGYEDFWKEIVEQPGGTLNTDQVMRELHDYQMLLRMVPEAYDGVTGGRVSKPHTMPGPVVDLVNERIDEAAVDAVRDLIRSIEEGPEHAFASVADVTALIRELTGVEPG